MKASFYNIYTKNKKNILCYNTKNDVFCLLTPKDYELLRNDPAQLVQESPRVYAKLQELRFVVEDDADEYKELCDEYRAAIDNPAVCYLTLLPSLDCNLRCWYCFEKHVKGSHLTPENAQAILTYVRRLWDGHPELTFLNVEMFGGEPLLYFREELYPLLEQIQREAEERGRKASFFFVTNGVCITPDTLPLFDKLHASFQISIDGFKDRHDQVKYLPDTHEGTYDGMIATILRLTRELENTYINLRINYDDETLPHMKDLIQDLLEVDRRKIGVHLERVWQTGNFINYDNEELKSVINLWMLNGFRVSYMNLGRRSFSCKASARNQAVISYDGAVYKCSGRDFTPAHQEVRLSADGCLHWEEEKLARRMGIVTYDNDMCRRCKLMPLCWGPCCQKQLEAAPEEFGRFCQKQHMELSMADYMRYRFNNACIEDSLRKS